MHSEYSVDYELPDSELMQQQPVREHLDKIKQSNKVKVDKFKQYALDLKQKHKKEQQQSKQQFKDLIDKH